MTSTARRVLRVAQVIACVALAIYAGVAWYFTAMHSHGPAGGP